MKNIKNKIVLKLCFLASISILLLSSCSDDDSGSSSGNVEVTGISRSVVDDPLVDGDRQVDVSTETINAGNYYIIRGSGFASLKSISFNGLESYFNPTMVTNNAIVVKVDATTPYYNEMDEMKIVTNSGTYKFKVAIRPPNPNITGFPVNPTPGEVITITGEYFLRPVVNFGEIAVQPISSTLTEIKVKVPNNIQYKTLSVTNVSGTTVASQSLGSAIYDDAFTSLSNYNGLWDTKNPYDKAYDKDVAQGSKCIAWGAGQWNGLYIGIDNSKFDISKYKGFRVRLKGANPGKAGVILNGSDKIKPVYDFGSTWTYIEVPFSALGDPTELKEFTLQEMGGKAGGNVIYIDDLGLILK